MQQTKKQINLKSLEATTLLQNFAYPIVLVTFKGEKEIRELKYAAYDIHTSEEIIPKNKILLAYMKIDQKAITEQIMIENTIKKKRLQTRIPIQERPTLSIEDTLKATHNSPVTVTMMNGLRIEGKLTQYDKYNLVVNIKDMPVLLYRHAIYQFQDITQIPTYTYREGKDVDAFIQKILKDFILTKEYQLTIIYKGIKESEAEQITKQLQTHIPKANIERRYI